MNDRHKDLVDAVAKAALATGGRGTTEILDIIPGLARYQALSDKAEENSSPAARCVIEVVMSPMDVLLGTIHRTLQGAYVRDIKEAAMQRLLESDSKDEQTSCGIVTSDGSGASSFEKLFSFTGEQIKEAQKEKEAASDAVKYN